MADNQNQIPNNQNDSVFSRVLQAVRGGRRLNPVTIADDKKAVLTSQPFASSRPDDSYQARQQEFLDVQSAKIARDLYSRSQYYDADRISAYNDFRAMDMSPEVSAALDIIADECVTRNERGEILAIYSENNRIKKVLTDFFQKVINVDHNLGIWIRELVKYGDNFLKYEIAEKVGIYDVRQLPVQEMHREEAFDGNMNSARFKWDVNSMYFEEWQCAHFRLTSDGTRLPYGRSVLDSARKLWKQLQLAEDAMLVYRIVRAPERRVYYIEVGNIDPSDVPQYITKIKNELKKSPIVDQRNGQVNLKYNPMTFEEDYFLPVRGDKGSKIDTLPGASNLGDIQDIEYLQNKLFAALKVPKPYLNYAESLPGGSMLSQADLRFSRTINRIQEAVIQELRRMANIHLHFLGFSDDLDNFRLALTNPSTQQELLKLETMKARLEVFKEMFTPDATSPVSYTWAMEYIMGFSKSEIKQILRQKKVEKRMFAEIEGAGDEYKETGLFYDLDKKFRRPGWVPGAAPAGDSGDSGGGDMGGGFGSGGSFGGSDIGMPVGDMGASPMDDLGGGDTEGADLGLDAEEPTADDTLAETKNVLLENNNKMFAKTKNLIENLERSLKKLDEGLKEE